MTEKFNNFNNFENNSFSEEEYEKAFFESLLDSMMILYENLKRQNSNFAKYLEYDYNQFIEEMNNYFNENKTTQGFLKYIISKNPSNLWVDVVEVVGQIGIIEALTNPEEQKEYEKIDNQIKDLIQKKREKKDIQ